MNKNNYSKLIIENNVLGYFEYKDEIFVIAADGNNYHLPLTSDNLMKVRDSYVESYKKIMMGSINTLGDIKKYASLFYVGCFATGISACLIRNPIPTYSLMGLSFYNFYKFGISNNDKLLQDKYEFLLSDSALINLKKGVNTVTVDNVHDYTLKELNLLKEEVLGITTIKYHEENVSLVVNENEIKYLSLKKAL